MDKHEINITRLDEHEPNRLNDVKSIVFFDNLYLHLFTLFFYLHMQS